MAKAVICHLTSVHPAADIRIFHKECQSLLSAGYQTHLTVCGSQQIHEAGIQIHVAMEHVNGRFQRFSQALWKMAKKAVEVDADIYHFHDPELIAVALYLKRLGKIVIYDVHEDYPKQVMSKEWIAPFLRRPVSVLVDLVEMYACQKLDAIVAATDSIAHRFKSVHPNVVLVRNFPMLQEFPLLVEDSDLFNSSTDIDYDLCYIGVLSFQRGLGEMVNAARKLNLRLVLAGPFSTQQEQQYVENLSADSSVDYLGILSRPDVAQLLRRSRIGMTVLNASPNHMEAYPTKLFEYMAAGLPVIASDFPLWRDIVERNCCGICVDPQSLQSLESAIKTILGDEKKAQLMGSNGRQLVQQKFSWNTERIKLIDLYDKLASGKTL